MDRVQAAMLKLGCPMAVKHNEALPPAARRVLASGGARTA